MSRLLYALAVGLFGAGIVHIVILMLLPEFSERDAWSRLAGQADLYRMTRIDGSAADDPFQSPADPLFYTAACRFDLDDGFARIEAPGTVPFWSVSVYDRNGQNIYSLNDRTSADGGLAVVIATPAQMIDIREDLPEDMAASVFVQADMAEGIALVRVFVPDETWAPKLAAYVDGIACRSQ